MTPALLRENLMQSALSFTSGLLLTSAPPKIVRIQTMDVAKHIPGLVQAIYIRKKPLYKQH